MACEHILLIDDDEDDRDFFVLAIQDFSPYLQCSYFNDAEKALHALIAGALKPEIIFLDLNMPMMTGMQCLTELKKIQRINLIPVIIYSTSSDPRFMHESIKNGAHSYIIKPASIPELTEVLRQTFSRTIGI